MWVQQKCAVMTHQQHSTVSAHVHIPLSASRWRPVSLICIHLRSLQTYILSDRLACCKTSLFAQAVAHCFVLAPSWRFETLCAVVAGTVRTVTWRDAVLSAECCSLYMSSTAWFVNCNLRGRIVRDDWALSHVTVTLSGCLLNLIH
jgi:hypothetical protein